MNVRRWNYWAHASTHHRRCPQGHMRIQLQGACDPGANIIPSPSREPKIVRGYLEIELGRQCSKRKFMRIALKTQHKLKKKRERGV